MKPPIRSRYSSRQLGVLGNPQASADAIVEAAMAPPKGKKKSHKKQQADPKPKAPPKQKQPPQSPTRSESREEIDSTRVPVDLFAYTPNGLTGTPSIQASPIQNPPKSTPLPQKQRPPYTISWEIYWKGKLILPGTRLSDKFDFDDFTSDAIKEVTRKTSSKGFNVVLQEGTAIISYSGNQRNVTALCKEPDDWQEAHKVTKQWQDKKRKGICVKIIQKYDAKIIESSSSSLDDSDKSSPRTKKGKDLRKNKYKFSSGASSSDDSNETDDSNNLANSSSDEPKRKKRKKQRKTKPSKKRRKSSRKSATERQEDIYRDLKEIEGKQGKHGHILMKRWGCDSSSCANRGHFCWQPDDGINTHLKLFDYHVKAWNKALASGKEDVSVERPPMKVKMELYEIDKKKSLANKSKKEKIEAADKETTSLATQAVLPMSFPGFPTMAPLY